MNEQDKTFEYSYSAKEQQEIARIRQKYAPREESTLERLRALDASATKPGTVAAIAVGVIGSLILGTGMWFTMGLQGVYFFPGVAIGLAGLAMMGVAYPLYKRITKKRREKITPEILRLTDELSK